MSGLSERRAGLFLLEPDSKNAGGDLETEKRSVALKWRIKKNLLEMENLSN